MTLKINGTTVPSPSANGFTVSKNKIWSRNTGRNSQGDMVGTIIAIKTSVDITWNVLSPSEVALIDSLVSDINNPFTTIEFTGADGVTTTKTVYFSDVSYPIYGTNMYGEKIITGTQLSGIEQ